MEEGCEQTLPELTRVLCRPSETRMGLAPTAQTPIASTACASSSWPLPPVRRPKLLVGVESAPNFQKKDKKKFMSAPIPISSPHPPPHPRRDPHPQDNLSRSRPSTRT